MTRFVLQIPVAALKLSPVYTPDEEQEVEVLTAWIAEAEQKGCGDLADMAKSELSETSSRAWWRTNGSQFALLSEADLQLWHNYMPGWGDDIGCAEFERLRPELQHAFWQIEVHFRPSTGEGVAFGTPRGGGRVLIARWCRDEQELPTLEQIGLIVAARKRIERGAHPVSLGYAGFVIGGMLAFLLWVYALHRIPLSEGQIYVAVGFAGTIGVFGAFGVRYLLRKFKRWRFRRSEPQIAWAL